MAFDGPVVVLRPWPLPLEPVTEDDGSIAGSTNRRAELAPEFGDMGIRSMVGQRPVTVFVVLAFVVGWWPWYVGLAPEASPFVPSLLAVILTIVVAGSAGLKRLLRDAVRWRAPMTVWAIALVAQPLLFGIAVSLHVLFGGDAQQALRRLIVGAIGVASAAWAMPIASA